MDIIEKARTLLSDDPYDQGYFDTHKRRYSAVFSLIQSYLNHKFGDGKKLRILELGSYHLHMLSIFKSAGYNFLYGLDLPTIVEKELIKKRANKLGITNSAYTLNNIGKPVKIPYDDDQFDVIICLEMIEHITFNPASFWKEILRITNNRGVLFIATPNALSLIKWLSRLKKLILRRSYGISMHEIFNKITTGHHWKEYSPGEMKTYFVELGDIFRFEKMESYKWRSYKRFNKWIQILYDFQESVLPVHFRSEMFYIYSVDKNREINIKDPDRQFYRIKE